MRTTNKNGSLKVNAIAGTYVVTLAWDMAQADCNGLLGFSILRADHSDNTSRYLEGMKAFAETDPGFPAGSLYPSNKHPFQSFQWADYAAEPGCNYTYTITALKGSPKKLTPFVSTAVTVTTESPSDNDHCIYFNRGNAASQEYIRRFGDVAPDKADNPQAVFDWLSRGSYEALVEFITSCEKGKHALRIAAYEFNYKPLLQIISDTKTKKKIDIQIIYDARKDVPGKMNTSVVKKTGLEKISTKRLNKTTSFISHNKFIVKLTDGKPTSVWTGGMNFSEGGIFGHSNVAHVVNDADIAQKYLDYWTELQKDPIVPSVGVDAKKPTEFLSFRRMNENLCPFIANPSPGTSAIVSPRLSLDALNGYARLAKNATEGLFMTFAFGMNEIFKDVYRTSPAPFRLALMEKAVGPGKTGAAKDKEEASIEKLRKLPENVFAIGSMVDKLNKFDGWETERLTGLNVHVKYIHNKFLLADPLGDDPIVVAGSANFSNASTTDNDENMLIIRGNKRVADIYVGEYMRLFSHFSFRESLKWRKPTDPPKPLDTGAWWADHFGKTPRSARREYFANKFKI